MMKGTSSNFLLFREPVVAENRPKEVVNPSWSRLLNAEVGRSDEFRRYRKKRRPKVNRFASGVATREIALVPFLGRELIFWSKFVLRNPGSLECIP